MWPKKKPLHHNEHLLTPESESWKPKAWRIMSVINNVSDILSWKKKERLNRWGSRLKKYKERYNWKVQWTKNHSRLEIPFYWLEWIDIVIVKEINLSWILKPHAFKDLHKQCWLEKLERGQTIVLIKKEMIDDDADKSKDDKPKQKAIYHFEYVKENSNMVTFSLSDMDSKDLLRECLWKAWIHISINLEDDTLPKKEKPKEFINIVKALSPWDFNSHEIKKWMIFFIWEREEIIERDKLNKKRRVKYMSNDHVLLEWDELMIIKTESVPYEWWSNEYRNEVTFVIKRKDEILKKGQDNIEYIVSWNALIFNLFNKSLSNIVQVLIDARKDTKIVVEEVLDLEPEKIEPAL